MELHEIATFDPERPYFYGDVCFDPVSGSGAVGNTANVNYAGFVVFIKPETFLQIAAHMPGGPERPTYDFFLEKLPAKEWCIGPPILYLDIKGDDCRASGHEGRHRTLVLQELGFDLIPVYIFPRYLRAHDIDDAFLEKIQLIFNEDRNDWIFLRPRYYVINRKVYTPYHADDWEQRKPIRIYTERQETPIPGLEDEGINYYWSKPRPRYRYNCEDW